MKDAVDTVARISGGLLVLLAFVGLISALGVSHPALPKFDLNDIAALALTAFCAVNLWRGGAK